MYKKRLLIIFFFLIIITIIPYLNHSVSSAKPNTKNDTADLSKPIVLDNPLGDDVKDVPTLIGKIINAVLGIVGSIALLMFIYGGFTWMTAAGNQEKVTKGKEILVWATVGIIVIFTSYALVRFVFTGIGA